LVTKTTSLRITPGSSAKASATMPISASLLEAKQSTKRSCGPDTTETVANAGSAQSRPISSRCLDGCEEMWMNADQPAPR
jgi:hypothetical protein